MTAQIAPWAVLLCKFNDDASEPFARSFYERLFTQTGVGTSNMVDFFRDISHGNVDVGTSQVIGWLTLAKARADYTGSGANPAGRAELVTWARDAATAAGADLSKFVGVVVCMNVATDVFGGGGRVVCDLNTMLQSLLGHEMGHGFGLDHSRIDGSDADYRDPWDTMSTRSSYEAAHSDYGRIGPGLNAANMDGRGWLDHARVWSAGTAADQMVEIRPLHRLDLPGWLGAIVDRYYVELRVKEGWDAGIPQATVLVHRIDANRSYLMPGTKGLSYLLKGDAFERGSEQAIFDDWLRVEVIDIDAPGRLAKLRVVVRRARPIEVAGPATFLSPGLAAGGGGWIIVGGKIIPVPPRSPLLPALHHVAALQALEDVGELSVRNAAQEVVAAALSTFAAGRMSDSALLSRSVAERLQEQVDRV